MFCTLVLSAPGYSTEQEFFDIAPDEVLEDKYHGYKTTLDERNRGLFSSQPEIYRDVRQFDEDQSSGYLFDFGAASQTDVAGMTNFSDPLGGNSFEAMNQGFRSEFRSLFTRDDSLIREFSLPQPRYFNQGYSLPQQQQNISGGFKNPSSYSSGGSNRSNNVASASKSSSYETDQPALISWFFSVIAYIREHPVISGLIALIFFSVISLIQVIFQRYSRPFG